MGCCVSAKSAADSGQHRTEPANSPVINNPNQPISHSVVKSTNLQHQTTFNSNHHAQQNNSTVQRLIAEQKQPVHQTNQSGMPQSNFNHSRVEYKNEIKVVHQSPQVPHGKQHNPKVVRNKNNSIIYTNSEQMPGQVISQIQNQNATKMVDLNHVTDLISNHQVIVRKSKVLDKVYGKQQALQMYHQNFEIPFIQVALKAH